ncbi:MAG: hypothetical protein GY863_09775 [bacterium]|nr:hypothetical protein [bacterium]
MKFNTSRLVDRKLLNLSKDETVKPQEIITKSAKMSFPDDSESVCSGYLLVQVCNLNRQK